jgi:hypothetical protein
MATKSVKDLIKTREAIFAVIIGLMMCSAFWLPYIWLPIIVVPLFGIFYGIKNWETNTGSTKNIVGKTQIGLLCVMIIVLGLAKYEDMRTEKEIEPYVKEFEQTVAYKSFLSCRETCHEVYGFQVTKPSTWHLFGNAPLDRCLSECGERLKQR